MAIDFKSIFSSQFFTRFQFDVLKKLSGEIQSNIDWDAILNKPAVFPPGPHTHDAADIVSGQFADARISQSSVTQHQAALAIGWSQITSKPTTLAGYGITDAVNTFGAQTVGGQKTWSAAAIFNATVFLRQAAGTDRIINWGTNNLSRWALFTTSAAESGSNVGSNFALNRYNDAGSFLGTALTFARSTGAAAFEVRPTFAGNLAWDAGNFTPGNYLPLAGGTMTGPITQANGNTFLQTAAGAKILSDPAGNTLVIQAAIPAAAGLVVRNSVGTDIWGAGAAAITSHIVADFNAGARIFNAGQLKVYDSNNDTPLEIGVGYGSGTDRNGYMWNRNNGFVSFGSNNLERFRLLAAGQVLFRWDMRHFTGTTSTQAVMRYMGWNNEVPRWAEVIESDATLSYYNYDSAGSTADRIVNFIGANMGTKRALFFGEVATQNVNNNYRSIVGNYGSFWHMNSTHLHLMFTNSGDQFGSFNSLRAMYVNITDGQVNFDGARVAIANDTYVSGRFYPAAHVASQGTALVLSAINNPGSFVYVRPNGADNTAGQTTWNAAGEIYTSHAIHSTGTSAALFFMNRSGAQEWAWYCNSNITRLWNGGADVVSIDSSGNATANNWTATSDMRLKAAITEVPFYNGLAELQLYSFLWKRDGKPGRSLMAQHVQKVAPAYVHEDADTGILSIDKGGLALEVALLALRLALQRK